VLIWFLLYITYIVYSYLFNCCLCSFTLGWQNFDGLEDRLWCLVLLLTTTRKVLALAFRNYALLVLVEHQVTHFAWGLTKLLKCIVVRCGTSSFPSLSCLEGRSNSTHEVSICVLGVSKVVLLVIRHHWIVIIDGLFLLDELFASVKPPILVHDDVVCLILSLVYL